MAWFGWAHWMVLAQDTVEKASTAAPITSSAPTPGGPPPPPPSTFEMLLGPLGMFVPLIIIFYVLVWRPESKRRKEHERLLNSVKPKDRVMTSGGLYGTVAEIEKDEVVLIVDAKRDVRMRFARSAIAQVESRSEDKKSDEKESEKKS